MERHNASAPRQSEDMRIANSLARSWEGVIDFVVTDHSPCPPAMKSSGAANFRDAWGGIATLSIALSILWTEASERGFSLLTSPAGCRRNRLNSSGVMLARGALPKDTTRIWLHLILRQSSPLRKTVFTIGTRSHRIVGKNYVAW